MTTLLTAPINGIKAAHHYVDTKLDGMMPSEETLQKHPYLYKSISVLMMAGGAIVTHQIVGGIWPKIPESSLFEAIAKPANKAIEISQGYFQSAYKFFTAKCSTIIAKDISVLMGVIPGVAGVAIVVSGVSISGFLGVSVLLVPLIPSLAFIAAGKKLWDKTNTALLQQER